MSKKKLIAYVTKHLLRTINFLIYRAERKQPAVKPQV
jgi:hypothetical protein